MIKRRENAWSHSRAQSTCYKNRLCFYKIALWITPAEERRRHLGRKYLTLVPKTSLFRKQKSSVPSIWNLAVSLQYESWHVLSNSSVFHSKQRSVPTPEKGGSGPGWELQQNQLLFSTIKAAFPCFHCILLSLLASEASFVFRHTHSCF